MEFPYHDNGPVSWFWNQIEDTLYFEEGGRIGAGDRESRLRLMNQKWSQLSADEIVDLQRCLNYLRWLANGRSTYSATVIMGTGSGDRSYHFEFLPWLVFEGRAFYESVLSDTRRLAAIAPSVRSPYSVGISGEGYENLLPKLWAAKVPERDKEDFTALSEEEGDFDYNKRLFDRSDTCDPHSIEYVNEEYPELYRAFQERPERTYEFRTKLAELEPLEKLLLSNRSQNLIARWNYFIDIDSETLQRRMGFVPQLAEHGWASIPIEDEDMAYTAGLSYHFLHPEVMLVGAGLSMGDYAGLLNEIGRYVRDQGPIFCGKDYNFGGKTMNFFYRPPEPWERYPIGFMHSFYKNFSDEPDFTNVIVADWKST